MATVSHRKNGSIYHARWRDSAGIAYMRSTKSTNRAEALRIAIAWENASREGATKARAIAIIDQLLPTTAPSILAHQHLPAWLSKRYPIAPCPIAHVHPQKSANAQAVPTASTADS